MMRHCKKALFFIFTLMFSVQSYGFNFFNNSEKVVPFGIISINNPAYNFGDDEISVETQEFFSELAADVFKTSNDGIVMISIKKRIKVALRDVYYKSNSGKDVLLYPNRYNSEQIEGISNFYSDYNRKGIAFLKEIANKNKVFIFVFGEIPKFVLKKALSEKSDTLQVRVSIFLAQSGAIKMEFIKMKVEDINTEPFYHADILLSNIEQKILKAYEAIINTIQTSTISQSDLEEIDEINKEKQSIANNNDDKITKESQNTKESNNNEDTGGDDDW